MEYFTTSGSESGNENFPLRKGNEWTGTRFNGNNSKNSNSPLLTRTLLRSSQLSPGFISPLSKASGEAMAGGVDDDNDISNFDIITDSKERLIIMSNGESSEELNGPETYSSYQYTIAPTSASASKVSSTNHLPWLFERSANGNFSASNGVPFPTSFDLSGSFYNATSNTTDEPSFPPLNGIFYGGGSASGDQEDISPLPSDFTEISELNKICIVVYTILFFLAAVGNLLVLACVSRHDRLGKSRTPLLIMNLCMADLIVTFFLMPTEIFWRFTIAWKGGDLLCKFSQFVRAFGLYLSSNIVICISVDRYFAIVYPLKLAGAVKRVKWMLAGAWIVSAVFAGPQVS